MIKNFENASYRLELEELPGCRVSVDIKVSPETARDAHKKALKVLKKDMNLPGFRKGKAPDEIVEKSLGQELSKKRAQFVVEGAYKATLELSGIFPLSGRHVDTVDLISFDLNEGACVRLAYEAFPKVPSVEWENVKLQEKEEVLTISDEDLAKGLDEIRFFLANRVSLGTSAVEGDFLTLSLFIGNQEGEKTPIFRNQLFKLCDDEMTPVFKDKLLGLKKGDTITDTVSYADLKDSLRGDTLVFVVDDVLKLELPELTDETARALKADSLNDLKQKLKIQLENRKADEIRSKRFMLAETTLAQSIDFELPQTFLKEKTDDFRRERLIHLRLVKSQTDDEIERQEEEISAYARQKAEEFVKLTFLAKQVFTQEKLGYSREELQHAIEMCSREKFGGTPPPRDLSNRDIQEIVDTAKERLVYRKAIEAVLEKAVKSLQ
ncbi:MAG: trigger factor [Victivallaceae bacterium]